MIIHKYRSQTIPLILTGTLILTLTIACNRPVKSSGPQDATATAQIESEETVPTIEPTPTQLPMAAMVNGEGVLLDDINNEILRYLAANPETSVTDAFDITVNDQIDLHLLAQAARKDGFNLSDEDLDLRIQSLITQLGSSDQLDQWISANHYTMESFRQTLKLSIEADHQHTTLANQIPVEMEQVELSQLLVYDKTTADQIQAALDNGTEFDWLLSQYHPITKGYLGWQAPGTLLQPLLEEAAFSLGIGDFSSAITTEYGYHFIKVTDKGLHSLSVQNRQILEQKAVEQWILERRAASEITILASVEE